MDEACERRGDSLPRFGTALTPAAAGRVGVGWGGRELRLRKTRPRRTASSRPHAGGHGLRFTVHGTAASQIQWPGRLKYLNIRATVKHEPLCSPGGVSAARQARAAGGHHGSSVAAERSRAGSPGQVNVRIRPLSTPQTT